MRLSLTLILSTLSLAAFCQDIDMYTDSSNKFSIGIPAGWKISKRLDEAKTTFSVFLPKMDDYGILPSYTVNLISCPDSNFQYIFNQIRDSYILSKDTIKSEGVSLVNGVRFQWILKKDNNPTITKTLTCFGHKGRTIYQLSFTTSEHIFLKYEPLFKKIFTTFRL